MVLWRICYTPEDLNEMTAELMATPMGGYLQTTYSYLVHDQALAISHRARA